MNDESLLLRPNYTLRCGSSRDRKIALRRSKGMLAAAAPTEWRSTQNWLILGRKHAAEHAKFDSVIASDFYIFDGGARFNGDSIMAFIKAQHLAGKRYEWNVTEPDIHISGKTAWVAYVNKGSITDASGTVNQNWLESAFLQKQAGVWKIVFMHSTRVPVAPPENDRK